MRLPRLLLCLVAALAWAGCDSSDLSDAERIVGQWEPVDLNVRIADQVGAPLASIDGDGGLQITSRSEFDLRLSLGGKVIIPNTDVTVNLPSTVDLSGTYVLDDDAKTLTVTRGRTVATFGYEVSTFLGGTEILELIADSPEEFVDLVGAERTEANTFFTVASGGSVRFQRATL